MADTGSGAGNQQSATPQQRNMNKKREDYLAWHDFFMGTAILASERSKDPRTQVGACIVDKKKKIVATGYNGMPIGCSDEDFTWRGHDRDQDQQQAGRPSVETKHDFVCHAEMNAIVNKNLANVEGCKIYVTLFPCNECAKIIIQSGITKVIYKSDTKADKNETKAAKKMLRAAHVKIRKYVPQKEELIINFKEPAAAAPAVEPAAATPAVEPTGAAPPTLIQNNPV